jgi:hypothetical protein
VLNAALELVMSDNILQFGDTHWRQQRGTAMGASAATNHANSAWDCWKLLGSFASSSNNSCFTNALLMMASEHGSRTTLLSGPLFWNA